MSLENRNHQVWGFLASDIAAASISASLVAPIVTIIDRATVEKSFSKQPLLRTMGRHSLCSLRNPRQFLVATPFFVVWSLYAVTFSVANASETLATDWARLVDKTAIDLVSFISTLLVNVPMGVWKDIRFAQIFGLAEPVKTIATTLPQASSSDMASSAKCLTPRTNRYSVMAAVTSFLLRDIITIFGSFKLAPWFSNSFIPANIISNPHISYMLSQLAVPAVTQVFATPLHILGLEFYRQPRGASISERAMRIARDIPSITLVRSCRIVPAFGAGILCNTELRGSFRDLVRSTEEGNINQQSS